jgi:Cu-Zn family superoxide dismutase
MNVIRRIVLAVGVLGAALALAGAFAVQSYAGGATQASAKGLTPGLHGIHVHSIAACSPTFAAAGGHYNPLARQHGLLNAAGAHAGDLPNLTVNQDGVGHLDATTDRVTLTNGPTSLFDTTAGAVGSSIIIHANEDDQVTDATNGGSGGRIACGVIVAG